MADATDYARLRRDVGASITVLSDVTAAEYFAEALEFYPSDIAKMTAYTRVIALRGIRASSAMLGKYAQNESQEDLTKVFDNLGKLLEYWEHQVELAADVPVTAGAGTLFFDVASGQRGR